MVFHGVFPPSVMLAWSMETLVFGRAYLLDLLNYPQAPQQYR